MISNMKRKPSFTCIIIILKITAVLGQDNNSEFHDKLKKEMGCEPTGNWDFLIQNDRRVQNMCVTKNYDPEKVPNGKHMNSVTVSFEEMKIRNIDDKKRTITMDLFVRMFWKDDRVKPYFHNNETFLKLPSVTTARPSIMWNPLASLLIPNMTGRQYLSDPSIMYLGLVANDTIYVPITSLSSPDLMSSFLGFIDWSVTISCGLKFSNFPFDKNICPFRMRFFGIDIVMKNRAKPIFGHGYQTVADGFEVKITKISPERFDLPEVFTYVVEVGFNIELKRQYTKYIYQLYVPCITIVIAASFSYIFPLSAIPGRVAFVVTQFLTLTNIFINQMVTYLIFVSNFIHY